MTFLQGLAAGITAVFYASFLPVSAQTAQSPAAAVPSSTTAVPASTSASDQLSAFVAETGSATGSFVQSGGGQAAGGDTRGVFAFARPGRFRWEVLEPYPQLLVADGEQVFFHDIDLNQVTVRPMGGAMGATPAAILFGTGAVNDQFDITEDGEQDGLQWLTAIPRDKEAGFERIRLGFSNNLPVAMEVLDAFDRTSTFAFAALQRNPDLPGSTFRFVVPPGADVVRP